jgi:hypothetical protein
MILTTILIIAACGGGRATNQDLSDLGATFHENPLKHKYDVLLIQKTVFYKPEFATDYPTAVAEFEDSFFSLLQKHNNNPFMKVSKELEQGTLNKNTLLVKCMITDIRIVSHAARMWGGVFAGSSDMSVVVKLIDGDTGDVLREKDLTSYNNPYAAQWTHGSSDRSLPEDMGTMAAAYVLAVTK